VKNDSIDVAALAVQCMASKNGDNSNALNNAESRSDNEVKPSQ